LVDGMEIGGFGALSSTATGCEAEHCSTMAVVLDPSTGSASLENLDLRSAGSAQVGTPNENLTVDDFRVQLWDRTAAVLDEAAGSMTIPPGEAWFALSAAINGAVGVVAATNETPIVIGRHDGDWSTSEFTIAYQDGFGEHWVLAIMPARWQ
jgi:hypothetical protein